MELCVARECVEHSGAVLVCQWTLAQSRKNDRTKRLGHRDEHTGCSLKLKITIKQFTPSPGDFNAQRPQSDSLKPTA